MKLKPCPFCGAEMNPFVCNNPEPSYWANGLWFLLDTHTDVCPLKNNDLFGGFHFGKAHNGEPSESLIRFAAKWNRRKADV